MACLPITTNNRPPIEKDFSVTIEKLMADGWIEETFFRGYLGRGLAGQWGFWPSLLIQSMLFAFHPVHWAQGWPHWISIFGFGCLAGWLVERRQSIWSAWGAHAFANLIPVALKPFV
jgi:membrane protease YdiL (CAAX protease family)